MCRPLNVPLRAKIINVSSKQFEETQCVGFLNARPQLITAAAGQPIILQCLYSIIFCIHLIVLCRTLLFMLDRLSQNAGFLKVVES